MLEYMALFGKKKKVDEPGVQAAENKQSNSVTDEMKVILEAREEAQQEKEARALERLQEQEAAGKEVILVDNGDSVQGDVIGIADGSIDAVGT